MLSWIDLWYLSHLLLIAISSLWRKRTRKRTKRKRRKRRRRRKALYCRYSENWWSGGGHGARGGEDGRGRSREAKEVENAKQVVEEVEVAVEVDNHIEQMQGLSSRWEPYWGLDKLFSCQREVGLGGGGGSSVGDGGVEREGPKKDVLEGLLLLL